MISTHSDNKRTVKSKGYKPKSIFFSEDKHMAGDAIESIAEKSMNGRI